MKKDSLNELIEDVRAGDDDARNSFFAVVHDHLRSIAQRQFRREDAGHTLQPTALVNEAWMRLEQAGAQYEDQGHFFRSAAGAMRRILIDHARKGAALKRGERKEPISLHDVDGGDLLSVIEINDALTALEEQHPDLAELVQLRFFAGLKIEEVARIQKTSPATVKRNWTFARAWLFRSMGGES